MAKKNKKGRKKGGLVAGTGIVVLAGLLIGFDPFGFGFGLGEGIGLGEGSGVLNQQDKDNENQNENEQPPENTQPPEEVTPEPTAPVEDEQGGEVTLKEVTVEVNANRILYNGTEAESAQKLAEQLASEYADELTSVLVKVKLTDAVYDTVEELKVALEVKEITYEIAE